MKPYEKGVIPAEGKAPSEELRIAVTFRRPQDGLGPTKAAARLSSASVMSFTPNPYDIDQALEALQRQGFKTTGRGHLTASIRGTRKQFEKTFGTKLDVVRLDPAKDYQVHQFYYPPQGAPWKPDPKIAELIDDAYIQWPHIYMGSNKKKPSKKPVTVTVAPPPAAKGVSATPPSVPYWHLNVPDDVARLLNASPVHKAGNVGTGIRVAMIDTGFLHSHPYFLARKYSSSVVLAPHATNRQTDPGSHGTGESANIFAMAPGVTFIGIKLEDDSDPAGGASILEGFQEALKHKPHVISVSMGYDLREQDGISPLATLPNTYKALEAEIQSAIASGIVVVFSAGNGHYSFPGQMREIISAGGIYVDAAGTAQASDYASAFSSLIYSGRNVPDVCGLVGMLPHADYIMLPVPPNQEIDTENSQHDGTQPNDGWAVFSGTSAVAPQLAGACALLLAKNPALKPADVKAILKRTAREVKQGHANPASDPNQQGEAATAGAVGSGLVDVNAAWLQA